MRALRSAPIGLVFFLLTLTYIDVGNADISTRNFRDAGENEAAGAAAAAVLASE